MKNWIIQLRKGLAEFCVLNVLRRGETYGYQLTRQLQAVEELALTESTIYPILARLREEGYLHVRAESSPGGPPRRYFSLTRLGEQRIGEMNRYWDQLSRMIDTIRQAQPEERRGSDAS